MLHQKDFEESNPIRKWGCTFLSFLYCIKKLGLVSITSKADVERIVHEMTIDECFNDNELTMVWDAVLYHFGMRGWSYNYRPKTYVTPDNGFELQEWYNPRTKFTHFMVGDHKTAIEWDPMPDSVTAQEGHLVSKRVFTKDEKYAD